MGLDITVHYHKVDHIWATTTNIVHSLVYWEIITKLWEAPDYFKKHQNAFLSAEVLPTQDIFLEKQIKLSLGRTSLNI